MLEDKTVLVLGAGASEPYGFPPGKALRKQILDNLQDSESISSRQLYSCGFNKNEVQDFHYSLARCRQETIDEFLNDRTALRRIGGFAIAQALIFCEGERNVHPANDWEPQKDWYTHLFDALDLKEPTPSPVTGIITFNYDRSLEYYFDVTMKVSYQGETYKNATSKFETIPLVHVHGVLGTLSERAYEQKVNTQLLQDIGESLKITRDSDLDNSELYAQAREVLNKAKTVMFIGVGYHQESLQRLEVLVPQPDRKMRGTAYEMKEIERNRVKALFGGLISLEAGGGTAQQFMFARCKK